MDRPGRGLGLALAACALPLSIPVLRGTGAQDRVAVLERQVEDLQDIVRDQQDRLAVVEQHIVPLSRIAHGLVNGARRLDLAAADARAHGFEWAGANPQARTDLLEGLQQFSRAVSAAHAGAPEGDEEKAREEAAPPR